jgi:hypothetical protein
MRFGAGVQKNGAIRMAKQGRPVPTRVVATDPRKVV